MHNCALTHTYAPLHVYIHSCGPALDELSCCLIAPAQCLLVDKLSLLTLTEFVLWYLKCLLAVLSQIVGDMLEIVASCLCLYLNTFVCKYYLYSLLALTFY